MKKNDAILTHLIEIIDIIQSGSSPKQFSQSIDNESDSALLNLLSEKICSLKEQYSLSYQFILSLASGKLDLEPPSKVSFANPYKNLHSELRHLTWQIQQIADGDFSQRVSFSGDFSGAINKMIESLRERQKLFDIVQKNEILLRESEQKLRESNLEKTKLFSIIAHDLKSPFHSLLGLCEVLLEEVSQGSFENVKDYISLFSRSINNVYELVITLLEWTRMSSGKITVTFEPINLNELVHKNLLLLNNTAAFKNVLLSFHAEEDYTVFSDENIINTILRNLLSNAIKYTWPGGQVTVTIRPVKDYYLVSVIDTGTGIEEKRINEIFSIEKESVQGTGNEKGTGLGLVLCKELVSKIKGNIRVESVYGHGSTFTFTIPRV